VPGSHTTALESLITQLPPEQRQRITLMTSFTQEEKIDAVAGCDIFAMLSSHEAFGLVFLEAWACRKPVIAANIGALPSVVNEGVDGVLARYDDPASTAQAIIDLWHNTPLRQRMGMAGYAKVVQHYTWDIVTQAFRDTYEYAIHNTRGT
jgi:glycosyltransferase involved in cell wall biosynthesis